MLDKCGSMEISLICSFLCAIVGAFAWGVICRYKIVVDLREHVNRN